jgi:hypothetical protein
VAFRRPPAAAARRPPGDWVPDSRGNGAARCHPEGEAWFEPIPAAAGLWLETGALRPGAGGGDPATLAEIVGDVLDSEREIVQVAAELSERYEEIDLLYTIEIPATPSALAESAQNILREVSQVVAPGAPPCSCTSRRRASALVAARGWR